MTSHCFVPIVVSIHIATHVLSNTSRLIVFKGKYAGLLDHFYKTKDQNNLTLSHLSDSIDVNCQGVRI